MLAAMACDTAKLTDAIDNFAPVIGLEPVNTTGVVQLTDAATGELITARTTVTFESLSGGSVIDMYSDPLTSVRVNNGFVNFGVSNDLEPSEENPVRVRMQFSAPGYKAITRSFDLTETGTSEFSARMVRTINPPPGVVFRTESAGNSSANGEIGEDLVIRPGGLPGSGLNPDSPEVSITLSQGTRLTDALGVPLTGALTVATEYYDTSERDAMIVLPESFREVAEDLNALVLGAASMRITDETGRSADRLSSASAGNAAHLNNSGEHEEESPLELFFSVSEELLDEFFAGNMELYLALFYDADQEGAARPGDVPVSQAGYEVGQVNVKRTTDNQNPAVIPAGVVVTLPLNESNIRIPEIPGTGRLGLVYSYLPDANLPAPTSAGLLLSSLRRINGTINVDRNGHTGKLTVQAVQHGNITAGTIPDGQSSFRRMFHSGTYWLTVLNPAEASDNSVSAFLNFEIESVFNLTMPSVDPRNRIATVDLELRCTDPGTFVRVTDIPGASIFYREQDAPPGTSWRRATNLTFNYDPARQALFGGEFDMRGVILGNKYDMRVIYDTEEETGMLTVTESSFTYTKMINSDICR